MTRFVFTKHAEKSFKKLSKIVQERILEKLSEYKHHDDILSVMRGLSHFEPATHRLRIGAYRLILELKKQSEHDFEFWILDMGHRKDVYR
ncbi:hypothetical protein HZA38_02680 [Candidatus Peregrinibacteria bacterium]|nr:hypothetical protein [Candidatus Peregrinibacteria bacterium]